MTCKPQTERQKDDKGILGNGKITCHSSETGEYLCIGNWSSVWLEHNKQGKDACHEVVDRIRGCVVECDFFFPTSIRKLLKDLTRAVIWCSYLKKNDFSLCHIDSRWGRGVEISRCVGDPLLSWTKELTVVWTSG